MRPISRPSFLNDGTVAQLPADLNQSGCMNCVSSQAQPFCLQAFELRFRPINGASGGAAFRPNRDQNTGDLEHFRKNTEMFSIPVPPGHYSVVVGLLVLMHSITSSYFEIQNGS
jgi:hypothetical protein